MATGKDANGIGAESRWREAGQGANDNAVGTPDGVEPTRAIKLEPDESAWDVWSACREHRSHQEFPCQQSVEQDDKEEFLAHDGCT